MPTAANRGGEGLGAGEARSLRLKIVVDCANGAAYKVAPTVLWELGAEVIPDRRSA
jgi:phosphoglucosamine mutase